MRVPEASAVLVAAPVATVFARTPGFSPVAGIGRNTFATDNVYTTSVNTDRQRLNTLLDRLSDSEITAVIGFVQELYRQAA